MLYSKGIKLRFRNRFAGDNLTASTFTVEAVIYKDREKTGENPHDGILLRRAVNYDFAMPFVLYSREAVDSTFMEVKTKTVKVQQFRYAPVEDPDDLGDWYDRFPNNGLDRCHFADHLVYQFREIDREVEDV